MKHAALTYLERGRPRPRKNYGNQLLLSGTMAFSLPVGDDGVLSPSRGRGRPRSKSNYPSLLGRGEASFNQPKCCH